MDNEYFLDLITFDKLEQNDSGYTLPFSINNESEVFEGHFPNQPILPGVVMIELVQRAVEQVLSFKLEVKSAGTFKFLKMIDPIVLSSANLIFSIIVKEDSWRVKAQIKNNDDIYFKADVQYLKA